METKSKPPYWLNRLPWLAAVSSGVLLALCFPRFGNETLVWLWAAPLMIALWWTPTEKRLRRGFQLGFVTGATFFAINLSWITHMTLPNSLLPAIGGWLLLCTYLALFFAVWGMIAATVGQPRDEILAPPPAEDGSKSDGLFRTSIHSLRISLINASVWVGLEWLRGWLLTGFGWNGLGVALHDNINLIQIADVVGVTGLSFLPMFVGCVLVITVRRFQLEIRNQILRPHLDFGLALMMVASVFLYGLQHTLKPPSEGTDLKVLMVQLAVPQTEKWDPEQALSIIEDYQKYTEAYISANEPDLVLWPESSLPTPLFEDPANERFLNHILSKGEFALMLGVTDFDYAAQEIYNGAALMRDTYDGPDLEIYHKCHLVPFGEFVPFRKQIPFIGNLLAGILPGDFNRGTSTVPLAYPGKDLQVIPLVCFEDTVGRLARKFVRPATQFIVNMTNDGWFGTSAAAEQHLANARFRCVELRRPMARACNTGVTCLIQPSGRVSAKLEDPELGVFMKGILASTLHVPSDAPMTLYARYGDWFSALASLLAMLAIIYHIIHSRQRS